jgi:beta-N-acetylhexosaminidase
VREAVARAGQRVMAGFEGHEVSPDIRTLIRDYGVGHVILFARNVAEPAQVAGLVRELQEVARDAGHALPLLVSVDQEGGRVARLRAPWTVWPSLRALGRLDNEAHARAMGAAMAAELRACGIRWNLAPVMDVDSNPKNPVIGDRSFGDDPAKVGRLGVAFIQGLEQGRVAACAKHFPGHGDTEVDSHLDLPVITHSRSRFEEVELPPFRSAAEAKVASVMTAHVLVPDYDETLPATLSPTVLRVLRDDLGYEGVVLSDDLEMKAIAAKWRTGEAAAMAAEAGCDVLAVCKSPDAQVEAVESLVRALESERIGLLAADAAALRVQRLKERFLLPFAMPDPKAAHLAAGPGESRALAERIAQESGIPTVA